MSIIFILGGARSGKSRYAQELAARLGSRVLYVATAEALDEEMKARIEAHRRSRPPSWRTLEARAGVAEAIRNQIRDAEVVIIDCLTLLVSNLLADGSAGAEACEKRVTGEVEDLLALMETSKPDFIVVSNEVGLGLVPPNPLGRVYRDVLGLANQMVARHADEVYLMVAGIPVPLKGREP
jgi:adenosylcobinamide kinase/adenosylcobinamide-phosphate guanylyltransferase